MNAPVDAGMLKKHDGPEGQTVEVVGLCASCREAA